jgi:hypothetical protein
MNLREFSTCDFVSELFLNEKESFRQNFFENAKKTKQKYTLPNGLTNTDFDMGLSLLSMKFKTRKNYFTSL